MRSPSLSIVSWRRVKVTMLDFTRFISILLDWGRNYKKTNGQITMTAGQEFHLHRYPNNLEREIYEAFLQSSHSMV